MRMYEAIKKISFTIILILSVPVFCLVVRMLGATSGYNFLFATVLYSVVIFLCVKYLIGKEFRASDCCLAVVIGLITMLYTIPLKFIGVYGGICTAMVYLTLRDYITRNDISFTWIRRGIIDNVKIMGSISLLFFMIYLIGFKNRFVFVPIYLLKPWAPAVSEELIFRVLIPMMIFKLFKLDDTKGNKIWVFLIVTIPFAMWHCTDAIVAGNVTEVVRRCYSPIFCSTIFCFLIYKYGLFYGIYAHALCDFITMCSGRA